MTLKAVDILTWKGDHRSHSVTETINLKDAAAQMEQVDIGFLVVMKNDDVVGVVSERDFVYRAMTSKGTDPRKLTVSDIMTKTVVKIDKDTPLMECLEKYENYNFRHLIVLDGKNLLGVISERDVMRYLLDTIRNKK